jgi:GT2 family glycosyltransferase
VNSTLGIIPTYIRSEDDLAITQKAIKTFIDTTEDADLCVIDDGSPEENLVSELSGFCSELGAKFCGKNKNEGFAKTVNKGLRKARVNGQNAVLVNADIEFHQDGWLEKMVANPADVVGALLVYPNGLVQHAGVFFSIITRKFDHIHRLSPRTLDLVHIPRKCPVTGALMLIKHDTIRKVGIFDENFTMGYEDVSYCHDVFSAGLTCMYDPTVQAIHHESTFAKQDNSGKISQRGNASWQYLHEKHAGLSFADYVPTMIWPGEVDGSDTD